MNRVLAGLFCCFLSVNAWAQSVSYEANPGLLFVGAFMVLYDSEGPLSYQTMTPREVPPDAISAGEVRGNSCQHGLSIPIIFSGSDRVSVSGALGDGSFKKALLDIYQKHPHLKGIYDIKVDIDRMSILTVYRRDCTIVVAQGFTGTRSGLTLALPSDGNEAR